MIAQIAAGLAGFGLVAVWAAIRGPVDPAPRTTTHTAKHRKDNR